MNEFVNSGTLFPPFLFSWYHACFVQKIAFIRKKIRKKTVATRAALFGSNMHQLFVGWGFAPDPTEEAYIAPPDPIAVFRWLTSKGEGGEKKGEGKKLGARVPHLP